MEASPISNGNGSFKKNKQPMERRKSLPFRRVKDEEVQIDDRVRDNSFDAKVSAPKINDQTITERRGQMHFIVVQSASLL